MGGERRGGGVKGKRRCWAGNQKGGDEEESGRGTASGVVRKG